MKQMNYPERGTEEYKKLLERYKKIFENDLENSVDIATGEIVKKGLESRWDEWKQNNGASFIKESVNDLLTADIGVIEDVWQRFSKLQIPIKNGNARSKKMKELDDIFKYTNKYDSEIAQFFIEEAAQLKISTCYYCEMAYINTYVVGKEKKRQFDLDHFIPKDLCPILGLSLFNFIPSCQVCNSRLKLANVYFEWKDIHLYSPASTNYTFDKDVRIHLRPTTLRITEKMEDRYYVHFHTRNGYEREVDFFHLEERYEFHKGEAIRLKELKDRYPKSARRLIGQLLHRTEEDVYEDLFNSKYIMNQGRTFSKLHRDILSK